MNIIAPSILSTDFCELGKTIKIIDQSDCKWIHLDVMDGTFVPNISFGRSVVENISACTSKLLDIHLMIMNPDRYIKDFATIREGSMITVHLEACNHLHRTVNLIKDLGCKVGVSINPHTSVDLLDDILVEIDMVNLMSVNPGFGGQVFIDNIFVKLSKLRKKIDESSKTTTLIEIDGGVNISNALPLINKGANVLVMGNACFSAENPIKFINEIQQKIN